MREVEVKYARGCYHIYLDGKFHATAENRNEVEEEIAEIKELSEDDK